MTRVTADNVTAFLNRVSFRDVRLEAAPASNANCFTLNVYADFVDRDDDECIVTVLRQATLSYGIPEAKVLEFIRNEMHLLMRHEADELLKFDGKRIFEQHPAEVN